MKMKMRLMLFFSLALVGIQTQAGPFDQHPVFSKLIGKWTAKGELAAATGEKIPLTETWTGALSEDGTTLTLTGVRNINGGNQEFTWTYVYSATSEIFECEYTQAGMDSPRRLNISIATTTRTIELKMPFGNGGELAVINTLAEKGNSVKSVIQILDAQGVAALSGTVTHQKNALNVNTKPE